MKIANVIDISNMQIVPNYALSFDGVDDYVVTNNNIDFGTGNWTVESFYTPKNNDTYGHIFTSNAQQNDFACKISTGADFYPYFYNSNISTFSSGGISLSLNKKSHIAYVYDGSSIKIYVDGQLSTSVSVSGLNIPAVKYQIQGGNGEFVNAIHDEVRIWNIARTQTEIQNNMNKELNVNETGLVAYYKMNEGSGTTLTDSAGTNDGTINGATWTVDTTRYLTTGTRHAPQLDFIANFHSIK